MSLYAFDTDHRRSAVEVLVFDVAKVSAVDGIREIGAKSRDVEIVLAGTDFLIGVKEKVTFPCLNSGWAAMYSKAVTISAAPRFVIGAQQRCSVGDDDAAAYGVLQISVRVGIQFHAGEQAELHSRHSFR